MYGFDYLSDTMFKPTLNKFNLVVVRHRKETEAPKGTWKASYV